MEVFSDLAMGSTVVALDRGVLQGSVHFLDLAVSPKEACRPCWGDARRSWVVVQFETFNAPHLSHNSMA
jgi:ATP sulfurylase